MLLSSEQVALLSGDLDYILARTRCDSLPLTIGHVGSALERDPDVLLDLVDGMDAADARWISVPLDVLRPLIGKRLRGVEGGGGAGQPELPMGE
jgi:hypothetical protein